MTRDDIEVDIEDEDNPHKRITFYDLADGEIFVFLDEFCQGIATTPLVKESDNQYRALDDKDLQYQENGDRSVYRVKKVKIVFVVDK